MTSFDVRRKGTIMKRALNFRTRGWLVSVAWVATLLVVLVASAHGQTQTPGQIPQFDPSLNIVDSVMTQDPSGKIGIGTTTPVVALDVAAGDLNLAGNMLKGG